MLRRIVRFCTIAICMGSVVPVLAQQTTHLDQAHQGKGNKGVSFRPVDSTGNPASFVLTARSNIDPAAASDPHAVGEVGTVDVDKDAKGCGVQNAGLGGSKGISGGGGDQNEELTFLFDAAIPASSISLYVTGAGFGNGPNDGDDAVVFLFSFGNMGEYDFTINEQEIIGAFTSTNWGKGRIDFSGFGSIPSNLRIHALKFRVTRGHTAVVKVKCDEPEECEYVPDGKVAICHIPPGNPSNSHTIIVSQSAVAAHLAHGDSLGECEDCPDDTGACCFDTSSDSSRHDDDHGNGSCQVMSAADCASAGGSFLGVGTSCEDCPDDTGACCFTGSGSRSDDHHENGTCEILSAADCASAGGSFLGVDTTCADCPPLTGACCKSDGTCVITSRDDCTYDGGNFLGVGTTCDQCPPLVGACCMSDDVCHEISESSCGVLGGNFLGVGTTCADCPPVTGACCMSDNTCAVMSEADCAQTGGNFLGNNTSCADCPPLVGACCMSDDVCHEISESSCGVLGGNFLGVGTTCADCPPVTGACCKSDDTCAVMSEADCAQAGGNFLGNNTSCADCPPLVGACCFSDGRQCVEISDPSCGILGGVFQGAGATCVQANCPVVPDCNQNNTIDSQDISSGTSQDCNGNDIPDECEIDVNSTAPGGPFFCTTDCDPDCNNNGIPDECDITECNGSPGCQDCNGNGIPDECDIDGGTSKDCNGNDIPDECEIDVNSTAPGGPFFCTSNCDPDCNNNGIPDECDITDCDGSPECSDCNNNGIPDECDIADCDGSPECSDCNGNSIPDGCEVPPIGNGPDCNNNGIPDSCETDCNSNGVPDDCDVDPTDPDGNGQVSEDCDENIVPDECQPDTDGDGVIDPCDLCEGTNQGDSVDTDGCAFITCDNGGPYFAVCDGNVAAIQLNGTATGQVIPPPETELVVEWSTDCAGAVITNSNSEQATITIDTAVTGCPLACNITFTCSFVEIPGTQAAAAAAAAGGSTLPTSTSTGTIGLFLDCNGNIIDDVKDIADGTSQDCNGNGIPDECEVAQTDCNGNGVPDDCDIDPSDPDGNGQVSPDCNGNGIPDECEVPPIGTGPDCNSNGVPDECDPDSDGDGIPDDCETPVPEPEPCDPNDNPLSLLFTLLFHAPVCGMGCPSMLALTICGLMVMKTGRRRWARRRRRS